MLRNVSYLKGNKDVYTMCCGEPQGTPVQEIGRRTPGCCSTVKH